MVSIGGNFTANASTFKGLNSLKEIKGYLSISCGSVEGLEQLRNVQKLTINSSPNLTNLNALSGITSSLSDITITNCTQLINFCPLKSVVEKMTGTWYVLGNGYNPTKYQILNGQCSPTGQ